MNRTYPLHEDAGLYFDSTLIPYVMLACDKQNNTIPKEVQLLLDINKFNAAVNCDPNYTAGDAIREYPEQKERLKIFEPTTLMHALLPTEYIDGALLCDAIDELNFDDAITASEFEGTVQTFDMYNVPNYVDTHLDNDYLFYLQPRHESSYFKRAYTDVNELVAEFSERLNDVGIKLPANFDLRRLVCTIDGTYYC